ncbi:hypothetical protein ['Paenibacillus yunnanensis' Narsing Rao et al. 2020]|uniref:hypothetical protein n=1 Tax=Paenibacillus tengchongensis TaxID=2608684 RepID=UPI001651E1C1|nr:hypothetical protein [Paenibacillus tengchongensis]
MQPNADVEVQPNAAANVAEDASSQFAVQRLGAVSNGAWVGTGPSDVNQIVS